MTTKPDLLKWVPDDDALKISDPGTTKRAAGLLYKEKPAFQFLNWLFNRTDKWLRGLQGSYYDIAVGSSTQVTNNEATHVIADLNDTLVVANSKVLLLAGTHTLTGNLSLSNSGIKFDSEHQNAVLDLATFTATFSGNQDLINIRATNVGLGDIVVSGIGSVFEGINIPIKNITTSNGSIARTSSATEATSGIKCGGLYDESNNLLNVPSGGIILWSGAISAIPSGWFLCDGTNSTPNLTDRFVIHADADAAGTHNVGDTIDGSGATDGHQLVEAEIPSHSHSTQFISAGSGVAGGVDFQFPGAQTGSTGGDGAHDHDITDYKPKSYALAYIMKE